MSLQTLIIILAVVLPSILQAGKKLKEKAEKEQQRRDRLRQREQALRTGREAPTSAAAPTVSMPGDARDRLRQLELERQARLKELRERAQRTSAAQQPARPARPASPPQARPATAPARAGSPSQRAPVIRRQAPTRPPRTTPAPAPRPQTQRPAFTSPPRAVAVPSAPATARLAAPPTHQPPVHARVAATAPHGAHLDLRKRLNDRASLREAILLAEVLGPPLSLREPQD